ncbi:MAG: hypothetical protein CTY28_14505 [Hyphomicrobium sp.]|nr:MAG: hypothetical protein CTY28_14505 [Hyphomicrobium sp.]
MTTNTTATPATDTGTDPALEAAFLAHSQVMAEAAEKIFDGFADATRLPRNAARIGMAAALITDCATIEELDELIAAIDSMVIEASVPETADTHSDAGEAAQ